MAYERPAAFDDKSAGGEIGDVPEVARPSAERAALARALLVEGVECIRQATHLLQAGAQPPEQSRGSSVRVG